MEGWINKTSLTSTKSVDNSQYEKFTSLLLLTVIINWLDLVACYRVFVRVVNLF